MMNEEMVGSGPDLNTLQLCDLYQKNLTSLVTDILPCVGGPHRITIPLAALCNY